MKNTRDGRLVGRIRILQGFTLIELLVVIAIISLLVAILLPSLTKARDMARRVMCSTNLRSLATGMHLYATENNSRLPRNLSSHLPTYQYTVEPSPPPDQQYAWCLIFPKYVDNHKSFGCPSAGKRWDFEQDTQWGLNDGYADYSYYAAFETTPTQTVFYDDEVARLRIAATTEDESSLLLLLDYVCNSSSFANHGWESEQTYMASGANEAYLDAHVEWVDGENLSDGSISSNGKVLQFQW